MVFGVFMVFFFLSRGRKVISFGGRKKFGSFVLREVEGERKWKIGKW